MNFKFKLSQDRKAHLDRKVSKAQEENRVNPACQGFRGYKEKEDRRDCLAKT